VYWRWRQEPFLPLTQPSELRGKAREGRRLLSRANTTVLALFVVLATLVALAVVSRADAAKPTVKASSATFRCDYPVPGRGCQDWQWKWRVWLPRGWQNIGACETGYGKRPGNWKHNNSSYSGAFGFAHSSWTAFKPVARWPDRAYLASPWQQYQTALAIYRRYGLSGWGCRGWFYR
jgi:hypothetical protein